jgi:hypothetical protein
MKIQIEVPIKPGAPSTSEDFPFAVRIYCFIADRLRQILRQWMCLMFLWLLASQLLCFLLLQVGN